MRLENIEYSRLGPVKIIHGDTGIALPSDVSNLKVGDSAAGILQLFKDHLLANGDEILTVTRHDAVYYSTRSLRFSQSIRGIPVINSIVGIKYDDTTKRVSSFAANFIPDRGLPRTPKLSAQQAEQIAGGEIVEPTYLGYYAHCCVPTPPELVWAINVWTIRMRETIYVDAITGVVADRVQMTTLGDAGWKKAKPRRSRPGPTGATPANSERRSYSGNSAFQVFSGSLRFHVVLPEKPRVGSSIRPLATTFLH